VFNEAQIPAVTFVPPKEFGDIVGSILTTGKHVTLCGPSGCGKTTLARKALDRAKIGADGQHWMSGRSHVEHKSWQEVFASEFGCSQDEYELLEFLALCGVLVIDDFHHLHRKVRDAIGKNLKLWHEKSVRAFIIGIAESAHHLLEIDSELGIRNDPYDMKVQHESFIAKVIELGQNALNIEFNQSTQSEFIRASKGIPSAIQVIAGSPVKGTMCMKLLTPTGKLSAKCVTLRTGCCDPIEESTKTRSSAWQKANSKRPLYTTRTFK
jgi:ABC-type oligopeptide transport system ATPase subunit